MKKIIITRGIPGSGKSYTAKQIKEDMERLDFTCHICSTDDYWYVDEDNPYVFDRAKIGVAHRWNQKRVKQHLHNSEECVIVDNTNTTWKEIKPYAEMAINHDYEVIVVEADSDWRYDVDECFKRNTHGVPKEVIQAMLDRFQDKVIIEFEIRQLILDKKMKE